jgi:decaprenylphospho-beta-D-ribofuranose 2-oxidase
VVPVGSTDQLRRAIVSAPARGVLARGLGRAYGDAAQNGGGAVLDTTPLGALDLTRLDEGLVTADGGCSLDALLAALVPRGWFPPVVPGTRHVTVGGSLAADIHGKNHHVDGSFARHVDAFQLALASGEVRTVRRGDEAFAATAGGLGLTGVVVRATLRLLPIETAFVRVDTERASDLDDCMARMTAGDGAARYSVAWIDCLARGASLGRSVLTRGDHARRDELDRRRAAAPTAYRPRAALAAPRRAPNGLLNRLTVAAFNELWFRAAPVRRIGEIESIQRYFHPLDLVRGWNRLYGRRGLVQYQLAVPFGAEEAVRTAVERVAAVGCPSFLAVLKRFGPQDGLLSFPLPGWTLALDIPAGLPGLGALLDGLDDVVVAAGGRVYLAKDSRLRPELLPAMYPRLDEWRAARDRLDPERRLCSDLARRLALLG